MPIWTIHTYDYIRAKHQPALAGTWCTYHAMSAGQYMLVHLDDTYVPVAVGAPFRSLYAYD